MIKTSDEMRKLIFLLIALVAMTTQAQADGKVVFTASAPDAVVVGDQFRLSYTVNTIKVRDFRVPSIKGFEVLMGPNRSQRMQSINGVTNNSITFTYILMATAEGEYSIPGATITADGNQMVSNSVKIKVLPPDKTGNTADGKGTASSGNQSGTSSSVSNQDLLITATILH